MKSDFDDLLLNETPEAVGATTPDGNVVYWNNVAATVFGCAAGPIAV
jgi:PAS domain-containing protein